MFEKDLPGGRTPGFNKDAEIGDLPLETCETMNGSWGFNITDRRYKTHARSRALPRARRRRTAPTSCSTSGPMPNGKIQPEFVDAAAGGGRVDVEERRVDLRHARRSRSRRTRGASTTRKGNTVYVHVLDLPDSALLLPPLPSPVRSARLLNGGRAIDVKTSDFGVVLAIPPDAVDPIDTIVVLELGSK